MKPPNAAGRRGANRPSTSLVTSAMSNVDAKALSRWAASGIVPVYAAAGVCTSVRPSTPTPCAPIEEGAELRRTGWAGWADDQSVRGVRAVPCHRRRAPYRRDRDGRR
ncbi:hypothetical protein WR25_05211 [Diploscapter pachys]|uniref:Uncharacterized protein n=1 Tax=Diploscapter pachys TaxID=2018661 RepID=A0A2A2KD73_9BILA|nr:hypothetical protein WR25_05211 [Diploscapter pachys]